ncbi:hypothetical protein SARC_03237 [Sphaeroforma arctica JP610]|uniref:Transcriptional regulatory protein n=1 Tax=Sphaeroforma arctica JP610 TaxID=667725 RepID=A0A0L0G6L4_9EUKA|nr:hypothetical protein SARC_03237 [Sphaeroforma arctica JP610]KNC84564.1 hypothetical protein SARC_03237 [Sphaeroforma arctica JP610]|eukprot:XP_014158466.1 hypothetical protein SARC_03237 [Sphaeroforma arctica JP610]
MLRSRSFGLSLPTTRRQVLSDCFRRHAGHNKWSKIKRDKAMTDFKRGTIFSKLTKQLSLAMKDSNNNKDDDRFKNAMQRCREAQVPKALIDRTLSKATTGRTDPVIYEARGPGGALLYVDCLTDSKGRTNIEIKKILTKNGAQIATPNSLAFMFEKRGFMIVDQSADNALEAAINAGADDVEECDEGEESAMVICQPEELYRVKSALEASGMSVTDCRLTYQPTSLTELDAEDQLQLNDLVELLEEHDDVLEVYTNT